MFFQKTSVLFFLVLLFSGVNNVERIQAAVTYPIVDTNQTTCYKSSTGAPATCTGTGYDADYDGNQPSYTLSGDGLMVTDNVTGLIWTSKVDLNDDSVVNVSDKLSQPDAVTYCSGLSYGGHTWRLPTIKELYSLMDFTGGDPSGYMGTNTSVLTPFIDDTYFERAFGDASAGERIIDAQYATTSLYVSPLGTISGAATMFGVNFVDGRIKGYPYNTPPDNPKTFYVHCVTGDTNYGQNDFNDEGDGTVSDLATGLMWEQDDYQSTNFEDAISHCENATTGGYADWRLPNVKELHSILDYSRAPDHTGSAAIDPVFSATSITNEGGNIDWGFYWASTTHAQYGTMGQGHNGTYLSFGRALGYYTDPLTHVSSLTDVHGAGAQRSNDKSDVTGFGASSANLGYGTFYYKGPQGDILRLDNMTRCVRDDTRQEQTISFAALPDKLESDPDFAISATATSGLTVSFSTSTTSVCTVSGDVVSLVSQGVCTIIASQSGDGNYFTAADVEQSFNITADSDNDGVGDSSDVDDDGDGLIEISSLADLDDMRNDLAGTSLSGNNSGCPVSDCTGYELTGDLDFDTNGDGVIDASDDYWNSGEGWVPVGASATPFTGTFDGNGYEISNLMINRPSGYQVGFFGNTDGAIISNLGIIGDLTSVTGNSRVAILAGKVGTGSAITNCYTIGSLTAHDYAGGIIGILDSASISSSFSNATVTCSGIECGGLVGGAEKTSIANSFATGSISADGLVGGLVAWNSQSSIINSYAIGSITGNSYLGGLIGDSYGSASATASYWDTEASGQTTSANELGTGLATTELQCPTGPDDTACAGATLYEGWDTAVWDFGTSSQYPALIINGNVYRDSDGNGIWDFEDTSSSFPWTMFLPAITGNSDR